MEKQTRDRYRSYFDTYDYPDEMLTGTVWKLPINEAKVHHIRRLVGNPAGLRVLDAGCGSGIFSVWLAKLGADVKAIDLSEKSIMVTKEWARKEAVWVDAEVSTLEDFQSDVRFDLILGLDSMMYTDNPTQIFDNMFSLLKPGGRFIFSVPNFYRWASVMSVFNQYPLTKVKSAYRKARPADKLPYQNHAPWVWEALLRKSGFRIENRTGSFIFPSLKAEKPDDWLAEKRRLTSMAWLLEGRVSDKRPFSYMGQCFIVVARKPEPSLRFKNPEGNYMAWRMNTR